MIARKIVTFHATTLNVKIIYFVSLAALSVTENLITRI